MAKKILAVCTVLILYSISWAGDKRPVTWVESDFPPVWIYSGPYKGMGGADLIQDLLFEKLSGYQHRRLRANVTRTEIMVRNKDNVCTCAMFKTPDREKIMVFNRVPSSFILANGIITKKSRQGRFGDKDYISLAGILKNSRLRCGITKDRKFGGKIDEILDQNKENPNILKRAAGDLTAGLLRMLKADNVDYILGFDWELQYLSRDLFSPQEADTLIYIPIKETTPYLMSYIACSKTEWGKRFVKKLDKILEEALPSETYLNFWGQWMSNKALYRKLYHDVFLKQLNAEGTE